MKVNIGPYPNRLVCNLFINYMDSKHGYHWPQSLTKFEAFLEKLEDFIQAVYNILNRLYFDRKKRKVHVRIDESDTWSMDTTLAPIILPMLLQLKAHKQGSGLVSNEDVPPELRSNSPEYLRKKWDYALNKMIFAFKQLNKEDWTEQFYQYREATSEEKEAGGSTTRITGVICTYADHKGREAMQKRIDHGLLLFGKYFQNLWD